MYKKIVRSLRKHYSCRFVTAGHSLARDEPTKFINNLRDYLAEDFGTDLENTKFKLEDLVIRVGALIQPKTTQRFYETNS